MKWNCGRLVTGIAALLPWALPAGAAEVVIVTPAEDEKVVLHNPDMGWVLYENYPVDPEPGGSNTMVSMPGERFEGVDEVAIMFTWFDVEQTPDVYDFSAVDKAYDYWKAKGKRIQLRMSTETLLWWDNANPPRGKGPPDYVVAKMSKEKVQRREGGGLPPYTVVDARYPYYLERLEKFLAAVAEHYRGERAVTLIDLRGFGVWGEWHTGFKYRSLDERRTALKGIIDRYAAAFPDNWVSLCYSYDPDGPKHLWAGPYDKVDPEVTKHYDEFLRFSAFDHALTRPNVTFRRDGCGGAVRSNERKMCEEAFNTLTKGPFMSEFVDGFAQSKKGREGWVDWKIDDALSLHPNYINLLGWVGPDAKAFMTERRDLFEHGLRSMGYRLVPVKLSYPSEIRAGEEFEFAGEWVNRAAGRAMVDFKLRLMLVDSGGKTAATAEARGLGTDKWVKGKTYPVKSELTFKDAPAGEYHVYLSLVDPRDGKAIGLALKDAREDRAYPVGTVRVVK